MSSGAGGQGQEIPELHPVDEAIFEEMQAQANAAAAVRARARGRPFGTLTPTSTLTGATGPAREFPTLDYQGTGQAFNPPDGALATGLTSVLTAVNESWALYSKSGSTLLGPITFQSFFGITTTTYDPRALFDAGNASAGGYGGGRGRFVLLATTHDNVADTAFYTLAVSQNDDPASASTMWCTYHIDASAGQTTWSDYPTLGMDGTYLYIAANQYTFSSTSYFGGTFQYARILVIPKSSVYPDASTGACPTASATDFPDLKDPNGSAASNVVPANEPDALPGSSTPMYFVDADQEQASQIAVRSMTTSGEQLTLTAPSWVTIASYTLPAYAPQPGGGAIRTTDSRLRGAMYRYGTIYTANSTGTVSGNPNANPYVSAQWYEITPGRSTAVTHVLTDPNISYWMPNVVAGCAVATTPCTAPFVAVEVSGSSATQPASAYYQIAAGPVTLYQQGVAGYTLNSQWGDYPGVATDPTNLATVWLMGEYAAQTNDWGTAIVSLTCTGNCTQAPTRNSSAHIHAHPATHQHAHASANQHQSSTAQRPTAASRLSTEAVSRGVRTREGVGTPL